MAIGATLYRFEIELSDLGRGVYETLELRVAKHPSENERFLLARVLAYALQHEPGIELGRGISSADEPAIWVRDAQGAVRTWIDIGQPSAERLHKASKLGARVVVYAHRDPAPLLRELAKATLHRKGEIEVWELPAALLDALERSLERHERWSLTVSDESLYLSRGGVTLEGELVRHRV